MPEPSLPTRHRHGSTSRGSSSRAGRTNQYQPPSRSTHGNGGRSNRPPSYSPMDEDSEQFTVDAIFSAHSDGLMVILRRAPWMNNFTCHLSKLSWEAPKSLRVGNCKFFFTCTVWLFSRSVIFLAYCFLPIPVYTVILSYLCPWFVRISRFSDSYTMHPFNTQSLLLLFLVLLINSLCTSLFWLFIISCQWSPSHTRWQPQKSK